MGRDEQRRSVRSAATWLAAALLAIASGAAVAAPPVPLLWKVTQGEHAVYLLGSFHLLRTADYPWSSDVQRALEDAESVLFEIPPDELESPGLAAGMFREGTRDDGTTLSGELDAATFARLGAQARRVGLPLPLLERMRVWMAGLTVSMATLRAQGLDPELGLDRAVIRAARTGAKPMGGLERGEAQVALLSGMDAIEQLQFLRDSLDDAATASDESGRIQGAWRAGDAEALWDATAVPMRDSYPALYRRMNIERNDRWLPQIEQRLRGPGHDDTLVVVGALHLLGPDGLVQKLAARGYAVERICAACTIAMRSLRATGTAVVPKVPARSHAPAPVTP